MTDSGMRILVVDDEAPIRKFLRVSLAAHDYQVFEAENGRAALSSVVAHRPDLIILDLGLPDIDGIAVTRQLREWTKIPILFSRFASTNRTRLPRSMPVLTIT